MKHLIDLDEGKFREAKAVLGTTTIKDTVNSALAQVAQEDVRRSAVESALDILSRVEMTDDDRAAAWR